MFLNANLGSFVLAMGQSYALSEKWKDKKPFKDHVKELCLGLDWERSEKNTLRKCIRAFVASTVHLGIFY